MSERWRTYGESFDGTYLDIHKDDRHHAVAIGLPRNKAEQIVEEHNTEMWRVTEERDAALASAAALREELEWYADQEHWACPFDYCWLNSHNNECTSVAIYDRGERARAAIAPTPAPTEDVPDE